MKRKNYERSRWKDCQCFDAGIDHRRWIMIQACLLCEAKGNRQDGISDPAHVEPRGMGGANGRWYHLVPLCRSHHIQQESVGNDAIKELYGVDLFEAAKELTATHLREIGAI